MAFSQPKPRGDKSLLSGEEKFSFSFYASDLAAVQEITAALDAEGIKVDRTKVVRCLMHTTPDLDLFAYAIVLYRADAAKTGPREIENVAERFTVILPKSDVTRIREVLERLKKVGITMNTSYVLRALLRAVPRTAALAPIFHKYLAQFPDGRSRAARAKKA